MDVAHMLEGLREQWTVELRGGAAGWLLTLGTRYSNETYEYADVDLRTAVTLAWTGAPLIPRPRAVVQANDSE